MVFRKWNIYMANWILVKNEADKITDQFTSPPIPVLEIAEQNGVSVGFFDFDKFSDKVSGFCDFKNAKIYINKDDILERQLFTIAHELGHWLLHKQLFLNEPDKYIVLPRFKEPIKNGYEQEANCFATELLVPKKLLFPVKNAGVALLAKIFQVSIIMMEYRLKNV